MECWEVVDINTLPKDANLIGTKWVFKIKYKNGGYGCLAINSARTLTTLRHSRPLPPTSRSDWYSPLLHCLMMMMPFICSSWYGVDLDAIGAFISAPLPPEEQVYLKGIPEFDLPKGKCLSLKKTI